MTIQQAEPNPAYSNFNLGKLKRRQINSYSSLSTSALKFPKSKIPVYRPKIIHRRPTATTQIVESMDNSNSNSNALTDTLKSDEPGFIQPRPSGQKLAAKSIGRSKSLNRKDPRMTQTLKLSSLSSSLSISTLGSSSESSIQIDRESITEMIGSLRACLRRVEKSYVVDSLLEYLRANFRQPADVTVSSVESQSSGVRSSSMVRSTPVEKSPPIGFIFDLNGMNAGEDKAENESPGKLFVRNLKTLRKIYSIAQNDLMNGLITFELGSLSDELETTKPDRLPSIGAFKDQDDCITKLTKNHERLMDLDEKLYMLLNNLTNNNIKLFSAHSVLPGKYEVPKKFEYILRLIPDIVYKLKLMIKICEKCYFICTSMKRQREHVSKFDLGERSKTSVLKKSLSVQCPIERPKRAESQLEPVYRQKSIDFELERSRKLTANNKSRIKSPSCGRQSQADSFIRETDCSSILSDDDYEAAGGQQQSSSQRRVKALQEELKQVRRKIDSTTKSVQDLESYLANLLDRAERCHRLQIQLRSDKELIRKTERSLKCKQQPSESSDGEFFKQQLEKQLDYLKYRYKLNLQDYSIEKMCAPEINAAIVDTQHRIRNLNAKLNDLIKYMSFIESKLGSDKDDGDSRPKIINSKTACIRRHDTPFYMDPVELPPLPKNANLLDY